MALTDVKSEQIQSSVALAGSPTTTTQSASDNSTKIATTAYADTAVANLVASAPASLNTLDELAAALNDDANFASTITTSIAAKLPLAGGTLTGDLTITNATPTLKFTDTDNNYDATIAGLSGSLVLTADSGTEIGTETIQLHTAGSSALTIDASQNATFAATIGIGGHTPTTSNNRGDMKLQFGTNYAFGGAYSAFGETKNSQTTIVGNNIRPVIGTNNQVMRHYNGSDAGNFMKIAYNKGFTFHTGITTTQGTGVSEDTNERMRIDTSGNLLVGTTNPLPANSNVEGIALSAGSYGGRLEASRSGGAPVCFNRVGGDGSIVTLKESGATVGVISSEGNDMAIGNDDAGIQFINGNEHFRPFSMTGLAATNALMDIGSSSYRFKDLFLSGDISIVGGSSGGTITVDPTSGDAELLLQGAAGAQTLRLDQNSIRTSTNSPLAIFTNNLSNRRLHIQNSTNNSSDNLIGIGTSSPQAALHVYGSYNVDNNSDSIFLVEKNNNNDWTCRLNHGANDYGYFVQGNGAYAYAVYNQPASAYRARLNFNGELYLNGGSSALYNINSDIRLKEEISDAPSQWELIKGLPLQRFKWIDRREGEKWSYGFIAQEVEKTNPEFVELVPQEKEDEDNGVEDPEYKTVAEGQIHERALAALQEAMQRIEALEAEVKALKGE